MIVRSSRSRTSGSSKPARLCSRRPVAGPGLSTRCRPLCWPPLQTPQPWCSAPCLSTRAGTS
ncbi:hypothetical protein HaLaN_16638, partial [Haematococcus lacustris]